MSALLASFAATLVLLAIVGLTARSQRQTVPPRGRPFRRFGAFARAAVNALRADEPDPALSYAGTSRSGRRVKASFVRSPSELFVRLSVSTASRVPPLRVRLEGALERLWKLTRREDVVTGDAPFDRRFFCESARPIEGRRVLGKELRREIAEVFERFGVTRLALGAGELAVELPVAAMPPRSWREVIVYLDRAAALVETKPLKVKALEGERNAACDESGSLRCVYCRDAVTGEEPDLVACDRCRTVVHDACWSEHGACPVLGCEGQVRERGRARP